MRVRHEHQVALTDIAWKMVDLGLTTGLDSGTPRCSTGTKA